MSHLLLTLNSSLNFLVYTCCTAPCRERLLRLLRPNNATNIRRRHDEEEEEEEAPIEMVGMYVSFKYSRW